MKSLPLLAAALLSLPASGIAAEPGTPSPAKPQADATPANTTPPAGTGPAKPAEKSLAKADRDGQLSADMKQTLTKAGFTDLQVLPNSVFVRGKDKAGHPVAMVLNPGSMTEMVTLDPHAGSAAGGNGGGETAAPLTGSGTFVTVLPGEKLASALVGVPITNEGGDKVGTIKDIAIDHRGIHAYIVGVGGIFGIGDRYVAVAPGALALVYDATAKGYKATMHATADQLKAAPEFRFDDLTEAKRN